MDYYFDNYYLDIQVEPDLEISAPALLNNLFAKFHRAMAQHCNGQIAVSFPKYDKTLGDVLRLFGTQEVLEQFMAQPWLKGLRDYTQVSDIQAVPEEVKGYRSVFRVQRKSPQNKRKRAVSKGWLSETEALEQMPDQAFQPLSLPYLQLHSLSNKQVMRVYIQLGELGNQPQTGEVSSYGLSRTATVPWF